MPQNKGNHREQVQRESGVPLNFGQKPEVLREILNGQKDLYPTGKLGKQFQVPFERREFGGGGKLHELGEAPKDLFDVSELFIKFKLAGERGNPQAHHFFLPQSKGLWKSGPVLPKLRHHGSDRQQRFWKSH